MDGPSDIVIARYLQDGTLDLSFGSAGIQVIDIGLDDDVSDLIVDASGSVFVASAYTNWFDFGNGQVDTKDLVVVKLTSSGQLDTTFSGDGKQFIDFSYVVFDELGRPLEFVRTEESQSFLALLPDGTIRAMSALFSPYYEAGVAQLTPQGNLDSTFGANGQQWYESLSMVPSDFFEPILLADGKYLQQSSFYSEETGFDVALDRYNSDATLDPLFGNGGTASIDFGSVDEQCSSFKPLDDGRILVGGLSQQSGPRGLDFALARLEGYGKSLLGTNGNDSIQVDEGSQPGTWKTTINGIITDNIVVDGELYIAGLEGDDQFQIASSLPQGLVLAGNHGSDTYNLQLGNLAGRVGVVDAGSTGTDGIVATGTPGDDYIFKDDGKITLGNPVVETITTLGIETRIIHGGAGNDVLLDPGSDTFLYGDDGDDAIIINATSGNGVLADGGNGSDSYTLISGALQGPVTVSDSGNPSPGNIDQVILIGTNDVDQLVQTNDGFVLNGTEISVGNGLELATIDGGGGEDQQVIEGTPPIQQVQLATPFNNAPQFTSSRSFSLQENTTMVGWVRATDSDLPAQSLTFFISGGMDSHFFQLSPDGQLAFQTPPIFDQPRDQDGDNVYLVEVTVSDGAGGVRSQGLSVSVISTPPNVQLNGPNSGVRGQSQVFALGAFDENAQEEALGFEYRIEWGDGSPNQTIARVAGNATPFAIEHTFQQTGRYTVEVVAIDVNGRTSQRKTHTIDVEAWQLQPDPARPGMHVLVVGGSDRDDRISLKPVYRQDEYVRLRINEVDYDIKRTQTVGPGVDSLLVFAQAGDDRIELSSDFDIPSVLHGGLGDDRLIAGRGNTVLIGGEGDDRIEGGTARDIIIGGLGADRLKGNSGDDILIAGYTSFDLNYQALVSILHEWSASRSYAARIDTLAEQWLRSSGVNATVFDDDDQDRLEGGSGKDWFFANLVLDSSAGDQALRRDKIDDAQNGEWWEDIDFGISGSLS